jgi:2-iminobutanoate/2-iminopropanoate deaminase
MKKIVTTDNAPKAIGPYNQAVIDEKSGMIFTAMQIALDPQTSEMAGDDIATQAHQVFKNLGKVLNAAGSDFDKCLKVNLYFVDLDDFSTVNEIYSEYFTENYPARAAMEIKSLPKGALIAADIIANLK